MREAVARGVDSQGVIWVVMWVVLLTARRDGEGGDVSGAVDFAIFGEENVFGARALCA